MTSWIVASATAVALGAGGSGNVRVRPGPSAERGISHDALGAGRQAVRVFGGRGAQIGVSIRDFNDDELKAGKVTTGVVIEDVEADSPAQKAGFKAGDIVVEFDGERVRSTRQFTRLVQETVAGRAVTAAVTRDGPAA